MWNFFRDRGSEDNHENKNQNPQSEYQYKSYTTSYSKVCKDDPEDNQYLVCYETKYDGQNKTEIETRVPKNQQNFSPMHHEFAHGGELHSFFNNNMMNWMMNGSEFLDEFFRQTDKSFSNIDEYIHKMQRQKQIPRYYNHRPEQFSGQRQNNQRNRSKKDEKHHYFFDSTQKDTNVKDL